MTSIFYKRVLGKFIIEKIEKMNNFDNICLHIDSVNHGAIRIGKNLKKLDSDGCVFKKDDLPALICRPQLFSDGISAELEPFEISENEVREAGISRKDLKEIILSISALEEALLGNRAEIKQIKEKIENNRIF